MILENYSLIDYNSFGFEVKASRFFDYKTEGELINFLRQHKNSLEPVLHIGSGNNLLFTKDYNGVILHSSIRTIKVENETSKNIFVRVSAGTIFDYFCKEMTENNFGGLENLSLIPSQIGASAIQNIGAYGVEIKDTIVEVEAININTTEKHSFSVAECEYDYRNSIFKHQLNGQFIITSILFCLDKNPIPNIEYAALKDELSKVSRPSISDVRNAVIKIRTAKLPDPSILGNAGSFFKNPLCNKDIFLSIQKDFPNAPYFVVSEDVIKIPAAYLIEQCGYKGKIVGNVGAYEKQPLVLVNYGGATPKEMIDLAEEIKQNVKQRFNINLESEVIYI